MKYLVKLEELSLFGLSLFLFSQLDYRWGTYALLFLAPDLSFVGYLTNTRLGAWTYNLIHHKGLSVALYISGSLISVPWLMFAGTLLLGHSSLDRVFGYGLKHEDTFQNTHLGKVGRLIVNKTSSWRLQWLQALTQIVTHFQEGKSGNTRPLYFTLSLIRVIALTLIARTLGKLGYQAETVDKE